MIREGLLCSVATGWHGYETLLFVVYIGHVFHNVNMSIVTLELFADTFSQVNVLLNVFWYYRGGDVASLVYMVKSSILIAITLHLRLQSYVECRPDLILCQVGNFCFVSAENFIRDIFFPFLTGKKRRSN